MVNRKRRLLALIYQHLLHNGYCKAARELQIESGEKFTSQKVSLKKIFSHWHTKDQKKKSGKQSDGQSKKPQFQDPASSSKSSDNQDNAHPKREVLAVKGSAKKAGKLKTESATPKKMKSAKKSASKVKGTPKTETPSLNLKPEATETPATLAKSSEDSDSEEETIPSKAASVHETSLTSSPADVLKSKTSLTTKSKAARNPVAVTPNISAPSVSKLKTKTPSTGTQPKADSSESSESESEEEPGTQKSPTPAAFHVKATTPSAKTTAAQVKATKGSSIIKATPVAPASQGSSAAGKTPAKTMVDESSEEDSDSEEELVPSTPYPAAPSSIQASKQKLQTQPTALKPNADDRSTSSETESEEEPVRQIQKTTTSPKKGEIPVTHAKASSPQASKPGTVVPAGPEESESSGSSDSESEAKAPKKAANNVSALNVRTPVSSAKQPVAASLSAKARTPQPAVAEDTSETEDSDSEEEPAAKKTISQLHASNLKVPSLSAPTGKTKTPLQTTAPATDSSETDDSDSDEEPEAKKTASQLLASSLKAPSTGAKQLVIPFHTANAVAGKSGNLLKTTTASDSSGTDETDSDEDQEAKKTASCLPASNVKTPSTGAKQPVTDDSSETEDSDSDKPLAKAPTPAMATRKGKPIAKPTAVTPASQGSAAATGTPAKTVADESSEDSDSDEEPISSVKPPVPTIGTPSSRPLVATAARVPDSDADSESSDSEEKTPAIGTPKQSKPTLAAKGKPGISAASQPDEESSSEDSDSDTNEHVKSKAKVTAVASPNKTAATPSAAPLSATKEKTSASGKVTAAQKPSADSSETSDSSDDDSPPAQKTDVTALAKHKVSTAIPLLTSTPSVSSPAKGKAGLSPKSPKAVKTAQALGRESSGKETEQVGTPAPTAAKAVIEKGKRSVAKTPKATKQKARSAGRGKTAIALTAKVSSESSDSNSSDEKTKATKQTPIVQTKLDKFFAKRTITPAKTQAKTTAKLPTTLPTDSNETDGEKPVMKAKLACLMSSPKAAGKTGKVSGDVSNKPTATGEVDHSADNRSEPEESQSLLQSKIPTTPSSTKRKRDKDETASANESIAPQSSKKKHRVETRPATNSTPSVPTTPGALLESEEETVLALLEGRSPKKAKKNPSKKTLASTQVVASSTVQDSNVLEKSLPPPARSAWIPESPSSVHKGSKNLDAKSQGVPELCHSSGKKEKHGKKRKSSSEDGLSKHKNKKAAKKEKKIKEASITGEATSPKPSKKEKKKSEKSKKKKDKKQKKKESKKLSQSLIAPVGESTDSGVSLLSIPKKKKKIKAEKATD